MFFIKEENMTKPTTKDLAIQAVHRILATESEEAVSFRRVAYEIGKTVPSLYNYFKDKQAMIQAAREIDMEEVEKVLSIRVPGNASIEMKIMMASENIAEHCFRTGKSLWWTLVNANPDNPTTKLIDLLRDYMEQLVKAHPDCGLTSEHALYRYIAVMSGELEWAKVSGLETLPTSFACDTLNAAFKVV